LIAFSIGCRLIVSNTREGPPLANENPAVPGPSDDALYDAAAKPDACHARGVGEGEGEGEGADDAAGAAGAALGAAAGGGDVCAIAGRVHETHAVANAATANLKPYSVGAARKGERALGGHCTG
jgi:hypothetical protein